MICLNDADTIEEEVVYCEATPGTWGISRLAQFRHSLSYVSSRPTDSVALTTNDSTKLVILPPQVSIHRVHCVYTVMLINPPPPLTDLCLPPTPAPERKMLSLCPRISESAFKPKELSDC